MRTSRGESAIVEESAILEESAITEEPAIVEKSAIIEFECQAHLDARLDRDAIHRFGLVLPAAHGGDGGSIENAGRLSMDNRDIVHITPLGNREAQIDSSLDTVSRGLLWIFGAHAVNHAGLIHHG